MRRLWALLPAIGAGVSGLMWSAARSDFRFRGCHEIPRAEWAATANCSDGWFAMVLFGGLAVLCGAGAVWLVGKGYA